MNTSLICLSLKYINKNYELIADVSKWIYLELTRLNYKESKFVKSLDKKDFEIIRVLIKFNENINLLSMYLFWCCSCKENYFEIIKLLIDNGADIHSNHDQALINASVNNHLEILKLLIDNGANVHVDEDEALRWASFFGHFEVVKLLIENGADVHAENDTALRCARHNNHFEVFNFLKSLN